MNSARWRGLAALVADAVTHGSLAVERIQKETAARPFALLSHIEPVAPIAQVVHVAFDASVSGAHGAVRLVTRAALLAVDVTLGLMESHEPDDEGEANDQPRAPKGPSE